MPKIKKNAPKKLTNQQHKIINQARYRKAGKTTVLIDHHHPVRSPTQVHDSITSLKRQLTIARSKKPHDRKLVVDLTNRLWDLTKPTKKQAKHTASARTLRRQRDQLIAAICGDPTPRPYADSMLMVGAAVRRAMEQRQAVENVGSVLRDITRLTDRS